MAARARGWLLVGLVVLGLTGAPSWAMDAAAASRQAVKQVLKAQFDRPQAPLSVPVVVVQGEHALAAWEQGAQGGRALLHRQHGQWSVVLCAGPGLKKAGALAQAGVPPAPAQALARELAEAESVLSAAQRNRFDAFQGEVRSHRAHAH